MSKTLKPLVDCGRLADLYARLAALEEYATRPSGITGLHEVRGTVPIVMTKESTGEGVLVMGDVTAFDYLYRGAVVLTRYTVKIPPNPQLLPSAERWTAAVVFSEIAGEEYMPADIEATVFSSAVPGGTPRHLIHVEGMWDGMEDYILVEHLSLESGAQLSFSLVKGRST